MASATPATLEVRTRQSRRRSGISRAPAAGPRRVSGHEQGRDQREHGERRRDVEGRLEADRSDQRPGEGRAREAHHAARRLGEPHAEAELLLRVDVGDRRQGRGPDQPRREPLHEPRQGDQRDAVGQRERQRGGGQGEGGEDHHGPAAEAVHQPRRPQRRDEHAHREGGEDQRRDRVGEAVAVLVLRQRRHDHREEDRVDRDQRRRGPEHERPAVDLGLGAHRGDRMRSRAPGAEWHSGREDAERAHKGVDRWRLSSWPRGNRRVEPSRPGGDRTPPSPRTGPTPTRTMPASLGPEAEAAGYAGGLSPPSRTSPSSSTSAAECGRARSPRSAIMTGTNDGPVPEPAAHGVTVRLPGGGLIATEGRSRANGQIGHRHGRRAAPAGPVGDRAAVRDRRRSRSASASTCRRAAPSPAP